MNRDFHNSRGSSTHVGYQNPRWRTVFIALMLALVIGSVGQTPTAQAAPAGVSAYFSMRVRNPKTTLRCGQTVTYHVVVDAAPSFLPTPSPSQLGIPRGISIVGVYVEADSTDKSVGDFVGAGRVRTTVSLDSELTTLTAAKFKFKANKPGKTTLYFDGLVGTEHVAVQLDVKVLPCKFRAKAIQQAIVAGGANFNIVAMIDEAVITGDEQGHFTGTTPVNWVGAAFDMGICFVSIDVAPTSQAEFTGNMDESGRLTLNLIYQPPETSMTGTCVGISRTESMPLSAEPLEFSMPSSGGVVTLPQGLVWINTPSYGSAVIVVIPVEDEAAAFIPADHEKAGPTF